MHRIISMCLDAAIAAVVLVPLFLLLDRNYFHNRVRTCYYLLFAIYLSGMFAVVGLPDIRYVRFDPHFNFVPFRYMFSDYTNSFLNVVLFVPLGFFLPVFWTYYKKIYRTVFFGLCASLLIEILQIFTLRATDINDLITNTTGTLLGWCIARIILWFAHSISPSEKASELAVICVCVFCVMFFVQPFLAGWIFSCL